ncbi:MAG: hypothetical protein FJ148_26015 [Deltaproteobacteria bacterium]|nr:hypothetical protein [Deltaproteobacteria bacterium]
MQTLNQTLNRVRPRLIKNAGPNRHVFSKLETRKQAPGSRLALAAKARNDKRAMRPKPRIDSPAPARRQANTMDSPVTPPPLVLPVEALGGDARIEALFWRAHAEELSAQLARLERRLLALSRRLPGRWAQLVALDPEDMPNVATWPDPLAGWHETTELESAHVATALPRLWDRLEPDPSR